MLRLDQKLESKSVLAENTNEIMQQICELAKAKDKRALSKLISEILCIDITNGKTTAIQILAAQNDVESVAFLIEEFNANIDNAVIGAAAGKHLKLMHNLLAKGADKNFAALGAAMGGDYELAKKMVHSGAKLTNIAFGAGMGNQPDVLETLFQQEADLEGDILNEAIYGAAVGGHRKLLDSLIQRRLLSSPVNECAFILQLLPFAALGGDSELVDTLLSTHLKKFTEYFGGLETSFLLWKIIIFAAQGGHHHLMEKYIVKEDKDNISAAAMGSAIGGHFDQVENMISRGANPDDILTLAIISGHQLLIKHLMNRGAKSDDDTVGLAFSLEKYELVVSLIEKGANINDFVRSRKVKTRIQEDEKSLLRLLTVLTEPWRSQLVANIKISMPKIAIKELVSKADILGVLLREKGLSFQQALVWQSPGIQEFLAFYFSTTQLSPDISFVVASYMSDSLVIKNEFDDLFRKMSFDIRKINLNYNLKSCYRSNGLFSSLMDKRPKQFASICKEAKSEKELDLLLAMENLSLVQLKESPYKAFIRSQVTALLPRAKQLKNELGVVPVSSNHLIHKR